MLMVGANDGPPLIAMKCPLLVFDQSCSDRKSRRE
jgi:hypothetical protein